MACTSSFSSLDRIQHYPIVNDSMAYVFSYYKWLKSKNRLLESSLSTAEQTLKIIKDKAEPIAVKKLGFVDDVVNNQLERLEKAYPIILESSEIVGELPKKVYQEKLQPTIDTLLWPVTKTIDTVSRTSHASMSVLRSSIRYVLPSKEGSIKATNYVIDKTDEMLDKYLPDNDDCECEQQKNVDILSKIQRLSKKTQHRLYINAIKKVDQLYVSSMEKLTNIQQIISDLKTKKDSLTIEMMEDYLKKVELKETVSSLIIRSTDVVKEVLHSTQDLFTSSTNTTLFYGSKFSLQGLTIVDESLSKLQDILNESKPEFISDYCIEQTNFAIKDIQKGLKYSIDKIKEFANNRFPENENLEGEESENEETDKVNTEEEELCYEDTVSNNKDSDDGDSLHSSE